jgi:uroporphyrinogen decarboxylase
MGVPFEIVEGVGPVLERTIRSKADLETLREVEPERDMPYLLEAIGRVIEATDVPLIGFAGGPLTLACYLVQGGPSKTFRRLRQLCYEEPEVAHELLTRLAEAVAKVLRAQVEAGARAVQLFESWAGALTPELFVEFALPAASRVLDALADTGVPRIYYVGNTRQHLHVLADVPAEVISVDWRMSLGTARDELGDAYCYQGNLDPCALFLPDDRLRTAIAAVLKEAEGARGHVFNLGHGITPDVDPDKVAVLVDTVHEATARA